MQPKLPLPLLDSPSLKILAEKGEYSDKGIVNKS